MSLINKMLQDLEARRAENAGRHLPNEVRALPPARRGLWPYWLVASTALVAAAFYIGRPDMAPPLLAPQLVVLSSGTEHGGPTGLPPPVAKIAPSAMQQQVPRAVVAAPPILPPLPPLALPTIGSPAPQAHPPRPNVDAVVLNKEFRTPTTRERANAEYAKAIAQLNQGRTEQAVAGLRQAMREDPGWPAPRQALLGVFLEQKRLDEAQELLRQALAGNQAQPDIAMQLARIQVERQDLAGAAETLQRSAAQATTNADFQALNGAVLQRLGRHRAAAAAYQAALTLQPQNGLWWMGFGISLEADGNAAEASIAFQRARDSGSLAPDLTAFVEQKLRVARSPASSQPNPTRNPPAN
jgi:MSHA biogenesis protein MshN